MNAGKSGLLIGLVLVLLAPFGLVLVLAVAASNSGSSSCTGSSVDLAGVPAGPVAGYSHAQLVNAAQIMRAAAALGLTLRDQQIGVMTAMGESALTVIDYGDAAGPDSRGLFQQRDNGAWGSYSDRMDPFISATNFFKTEMRIDGRDTLEPTIVAHRVQRNADPYYYTKYWDKAVTVVQALAGTTAAATSTSCTTAVDTSSGVVAGGWALPAPGPITDPYGPRINPITHVAGFHHGVDLAGGGCSKPIRAAAAGTVVRAGPAAIYGNLIELDHGGGVHTRYGHMYPPDILVAVGDQVQAGQVIARIGSAGNSTGCHLHFEVLLNGTNTEPVVYLAQKGITV